MDIQVAAGYHSAVGPLVEGSTESTARPRRGPRRTSAALPAWCTPPCGAGLPSGRIGSRRGLTNGPVGGLRGWSGGFHGDVQACARRAVRRRPGQESIANRAASSVAEGVRSARAAPRRSRLSPVALISANPCVFSVSANMNLAFLVMVDVVGRGRGMSFCSRPTFSTQCHFRRASCRRARGSRSWSGYRF